MAHHLLARQCSLAWLVVVLIFIKVRFNEFAPTYDDFTIDTNGRILQGAAQFIYLTLTEALIE